MTGRRHASERQHTSQEKALAYNIGVAEPTLVGLTLALNMER